MYTYIQTTLEREGSGKTCFQKFRYFHLYGEQ